MDEKLKAIEEKFCHLEASFCDPDILCDPAAYARRMKEYRALEPTVEKYRALCRTLCALKEAEQLLASPNLDAELRLLAAEELREEYPERTIITVDTLCASLGYGLFVYHAVQRQREGATLTELAAYLEDNKMHLAHWFTVEDLFFLKRGGRISATTAIVGTMLNIKPIIAVQDGVVANVAKARGPKAADKQLRDLVAKSGGIDFSKPLCAAYSGSEDDNLKVFLSDSTEMLCDTEAPIASVGCVIGAHVGPGAVAIAYFQN